MMRHVLPNVMGPVLVLTTIDIGQAILAEATLSFLGVGVPPTSPSLGTLIRIGNELREAEVEFCAVAEAVFAPRAQWHICGRIDLALCALAAGRINEENALRFASKRGRVARWIDAMHKEQGIAADNVVRLSMQTPTAPKPIPAPRTAPAAAASAMKLR